VAVRRASREPKNPKSCHERALGLLAVRPRSRRELERRLLVAGFPSDEVRDVLMRLERVGLVDDEAFARQYAEHRFGTRKEGSRAVVNGLRAAGIAPTLAVAVADEAPEEEEERATALAVARASRLRGLPPPKAFSRLSSLLMRRGYGPEIARAAARKALALEDPDGSL
jgi:regulatory protein